MQNIKCNPNLCGSLTFLVWWKCEVNCTSQWPIRQRACGKPTPWRAEFKTRHTRTRWRLKSGESKRQRCETELSSITRHSHHWHEVNVFFCVGQGEGVSSFLATLASSSSEEIEAALQERVESSCKQANRVVEIYENLKNTVDQLKKNLESGAGERLWTATNTSQHTPA